ncbi:MAG: hypothetical protein RMI43_06340 [Candidatus Caldarchaeum sp.]|nr:hypothetical protein [Candidatus Caldarchaeum sp.]
MKVWVGLVLATLLAGLFLATLFAGQPREQITHATITRYQTITAFSTVTRYTTVDKPGYSLPSALLEKLSSVVPNYEREEAYHIIVPSAPGTYSYGFAVFWKYGENHTHLLVFHAPENARYVFDVASFIQTRFVAAKNIPNVQASVFPRAELTETVVTSDGHIMVKKWDIQPTMPGYPSTPQIERGGSMVWVVSYKPLENVEYGESLVARYYFLEITVLK